MEKYQAQRNNLEDQEGNGEPQPSQDEINSKNNTKTLDAAAEVASATNIPWAKAVGTAYKIANEASGGKVGEKAGQLMNEVNKVAPGGKKVQNLSNKAAESGAADAVGTAFSVKNGGGSNGAATANAIMNGVEARKEAAANHQAVSDEEESEEQGSEERETEGQESEESKSNDQRSSSSSAPFGKKIGLGGGKLGGLLNALGSGDKESEGSGFSKFTSKMPLALKIKIYGVLIIAFFLILIIYSEISDDDDAMNLSATNGEVEMISSTDKVSRKCTAEELQKRLIYVTDKRFNGISSLLGIDEADHIYNVSYSNEPDWFTNDAIPRIKKRLEDKNDGIVIISVGIDDLANYDNYIYKFKELLNDSDSPYGDTKIDAGKNVFFLTQEEIDTNSLPEGKTITNDDIKAFNEALTSNISNKAVIDIYNNVYSSGTMVNGITFSSDDLKEINRYIISYLSTLDSIKCYSSFNGVVGSNSLNGGGKNILDKSLIEVIGQEAVDEWSEAVRKEATPNYGTALGPVSAAHVLIDTALNYGFILPYFWGGGHSVIIGINGAWGSTATVGKTGNINRNQPPGSSHPLGMDCSGFVSWALINGGCKSFSPVGASQFDYIGETISVEQAKPGDIASSAHHVVLIMENTGNSLKVAEARGTKYGIVYSEYPYSYFTNSKDKYAIRGMSNYYAKNCKGGQ